MMLPGSLAAQVWHGAQGVVEAVRKICRTNDQRQFHDLPLVEKPSQFCERAFANRCRTSRDPFSVQNYRFLLVIKQRAALIE